ncbi:CYTH-like domain-containing protein [Suillus plorans]|uniref:mRNA-capping enzyme subunit beta n=1 Tax=Suillus plorans TaxID=116603 RepID=A0A9P7APZ2_9AGAM|nr:CYTH-like domain-containing protein [Suillus plorans]KAG1792952.1 CYTH-like domain-containing protein [Suillus plorans]
MSDDSHSQSDDKESPPLKRARHDDQSFEATKVNQSSVPSTMNTSLPPLSLSILGVEPLDEFIREIADFVHHMIVTRPVYPDAKIEVEAKLGVLRDRTSGQRMVLPVLVETILIPNLNEVDVRFESNMSLNQHRHFNNMLNDLKRISSQPSHPTSPLEYTHVKVVDSFYLSEDREKIRVTREEKSNTVLEITRKIRLGNLNIFSPKRAADWRVSVSLEVPVPHPVGSPTHIRRKDRICYSHEEFNIDLTQVHSSNNTTSNPPVPPQIFHELEVEIARSALLLSTASKRGDPNASEIDRNAFDELIRSFVNNARILVKNANDGWHT